jgi:hypothetical protein
VDVHTSDEQKYCEVHTKVAENMSIVSKLRHLVLYIGGYFLLTQKKTDGGFRGNGDSQWVGRRTLTASETSLPACRSAPWRIHLWHFYILCLLLLCFRTFLFWEGVTGDAEVMCTTGGHGRD